MSIRPAVAAHCGNQGIVEGIVEEKAETKEPLGGLFLKSLLETAKEHGLGLRGVHNFAVTSTDCARACRGDGEEPFKDPKLQGRIVDDLVAGNTALMMALTESDAQKKLLQEREKKLSASMCSLQGELKQSGRKQELLQKDLESLKGRVKSLEEDNAGLTEQLRLSVAKALSLQKDPDCLKRIGFLEIENQKLTGTCKSLNKEMNKAEAQKQSYEKQIKALKEQYQSLQSRYQSLAQSANAKKSPAPEKETLDKLRRQFEDLKRGNEILFHQLNLAKSQEKSAREAESRTCDKAREDTILMKRELQELKKLLGIQLSLASKLESERGNLTKVSDAALANAEAEKQALVGRVSHLSVELERVSAISKTREQKCAEMTKKLEQALARVDQLTRVRFYYRPNPHIPLKTTEA